MRPFVRINMAMSADGKVATANRAVHTFGSPRDGRHLHELRAASDAIVCGARTVEETGATLGNGGRHYDKLRQRLGRRPHPVRVVVSGSASLSPDAPLWKDRSAPVVAWVSASAPASRIRRLAALADEKVPLQTIAPKFTGRFNKGVDYVGDLARFEREFNDDLAVIAHAVRRHGLPGNLKLSVHSGSDKFSLYPVIRRALARTGAGVHLKTAGTTWLEEMIGLAESGPDGLAFVKSIYADALGHVDELCAPYASVIDIDRARLPSAAEVNGWEGARLAAALRHEPSDPRFHAGMRQLVHVAFKLAAKRGAAYTDLLKAHREVVGRSVTDNLFRRHLRPLFVG